MEQSNILFGAITFTLLSMAIVSAINITAGESYSLELPESFDYYSMVGNSTDIDLNVTQEGTNVTITLGKYVQSDSFTLIFFNKEKEIITEHHYSGGGGSSSRTIYKDRNNTITKYVDVPGDKITDKETITKTEVVNKIPIWVWILIGGLSLTFISLICLAKRNRKAKY